MSPSGATLASRFLFHLTFGSRRTVGRSELVPHPGNFSLVPGKQIRRNHWKFSAHGDGDYFRAEVSKLESISNTEAFFHLCSVSESLSSRFKTSCFPFSGRGLKMSVGSKQPFNRFLCVNSGSSRGACLIKASKCVGSLWHVLLSVYPGKIQPFPGSAAGAAQVRYGQQPTSWVRSVWLLWV